jgi:hypothetical protein
VDLRHKYPHKINQRQLVVVEGVVQEGVLDILIQVLLFLEAQQVVQVQHLLFFV